MPVSHQYRSQFRYSYAGRLCDLLAQITFGSTGAPTLTGGRDVVASVTRNSAGNYTIALTSQAQAVLGLNLMITNATAPSAPLIYMVSQAVNTSTPSFIVQYTNSTGTATDPSSGELHRLDIVVNESSQGPK